MQNRRMPRKSGHERAQAKKPIAQTNRPQWNTYLTDSSTYQLNQDQQIQKKIQMLTKIPTDVSFRPLHKAHHASPEHIPPTRKPSIPRQNGTALSSNTKTAIPRVNFDDELRAYRNTTSIRTTPSKNDVQKIRLQKEIDRMDAMLASLELHADEISGVVEDEDNQVDHNITNTTHNESIAVEQPSPPASHSTQLLSSDLLELVNQLQAEILEERRLREEQQNSMILMQKTLNDVVHSHGTLHEDFKRAVKHIVKLKGVVTSLSQTIKTIQEKQEQRLDSETTHERNPSVSTKSTVNEVCNMNNTKTDRLLERHSSHVYVQEQVPIIDVHQYEDDENHLISNDRNNVASLQGSRSTVHRSHEESMHPRRYPMPPRTHEQVSFSINHPTLYSKGSS